MGWLSKLFHLETSSTRSGGSLGSGSVSGAAGTIDAKPKNDARSEACNRLKLVLMHDRTKLSPDTMEKMRDELVEVICKYVEIDKQALELTLESESDTIALVANIPVLRSRAAS